MKKNNLMSGAVILSISAILAKIFSAVYRIALTRILGGEGIGIYQLIFPFYSLCVVLATAGLPMAISKVIAKRNNNELGVIKKCFMFTSVIALTLTFILIISSKGLASIQGYKEIYICYIILSPTIILVSASSVLRGYFQGKHNFTPSAISNITEQFIKLCVGLILSLSLVSISVLASIIGAIIGIVLSEIISLVILILFIKNHRLSNNKVDNVSIKELAKDVLPITLTNVILPIASFIDSVIVVNLLAISFSKNVSVFLYGLESGAVSSLVSIPTIFSFAIASVILPNLTTNNRSYNRNYRLSLAVKVVLIIVVPCVVCLVLFPNRILEFLYSTRLDAYGIDSINVASKLLSISSLGVIFLAINQIYSSSLQAVDERFVTIRNLSLAVIVKFILQCVFLPSKMLNIYALAIANTACYVTVMVLNHVEVKNHFKFNIEYCFWVKLVFSNCVMILATLSIMTINNGKLNTVLAFIVGALVYLISLIKTQIATKKDRATLKYKV